jgi:hypothetical protein
MKTSQFYFDPPDEPDDPPRYPDELPIDPDDFPSYGKPKEFCPKCLKEEKRVA